MARKHLPPATMSQMRMMGPAEDTTAVPDGNIRTCSTGPLLDELPLMVISHSPVLESNSRTVESYEPVSTRFGSQVENCPVRT